MLKFGEAKFKVKRKHRDLTFGDMVMWLSIYLAIGVIAMAAIGYFTT